VLYFKIAFRDSFLKRPIRTLFTIISIVLGVGVFFAVNIASDSLSYSLQQQLDPVAFGDIETWLQLFRGIIIIFSAISLIVLVLIVKNLMEMAKEEKIHEIGVLRTIGISKSGIFKIFFYQISIITIIGVSFGLILGSVIAQLFFGPFKNIMSGFLYATDFDIIFYFSPLSLIITVIVGLLIPMVFGMIPAIAASNTNIIEALYPRTRSKNELFISISKLIAFTVISIILIIVGVFILSYGFEGLIDLADLTVLNYISILLLFIGGFFFITGVILLSSNFITYLSVGISYIFYPILRKMRNITVKNLRRNARRTKNTFAMVAITLASLITIVTLIQSIQAGMGPGARMRLGGDIRLGMYYQFNDHRQIPLNTSLNLTQIDGISSVCEVKNSYYVTNYSMCDEFGMRTGERFVLFVINTSAYVEMHSQNSITKFQGDSSQSLETFMTQLETNRTIILHDDLSNEINKGTGEDVNITTDYTIYFPGLSYNFSVVGIMDIMPGLQFTWDAQPNNYKYYYAIISWNSFYNVTGLNYNTSTGYFWLGLDNPTTSETVISEVETLYTNLGSPWTNHDFSDEWRYRTYTDEVIQIQEVINLILIIFTNILQISIVISLFGLSITILMNVNHRKKEIGILRSFGISKPQINTMIFGESMIIASFAIIMGLTAGSSASFLMALTIPFMPYVPVFYSFPWIDILILSIIVFIFSIISSIIPALRANKINIVDAIRTRG